MQKINLNNLYESSTPLEDINNLWVDIDEDTGDIKAIHRYNKDKGEWEPYLVSVHYLMNDGKPEGPPDEDDDEHKGPGGESQETGPSDQEQQEGGQ